MNNELIKDYLIEQSKQRTPVGVSRELELAENSQRAIVIIGPRRSGKTYFFHQLINGATDAVYINFEDTRLLDVKFNEIRDIIRLFIETFGYEPRRLFFDEIQNVKSWELAVRELLDTGKYQVYLTGSSSRLLGSEIATQLRGRALRYVLLPFSFREFLAAKRIEKNDKLTLDEKALLKNLFKEYLEWGGFPEVVLEQKERERILKEYFDMILFKDVVERYGIKNIALARFIMAHMIQNFAKEISVNKILTKAGSAAKSRETVYNYFDKVQDSAAFFFVNTYSLKVHLRESWPKKVYVCDNGLTKTAKFSEDIGKLMENVTFLELSRMTNKHPLMEIYFLKMQNCEVDFVLKEGNEVTRLIQVTYASKREDIDKREINSLLTGSEITKCKDLLVLTWDFKGQESNSNVNIVFKPLWEWLQQAK